MKRLFCVIPLVCLLYFVVGCQDKGAMASEVQQKQSPKSPSIEGTYKLISRKLSDGTMLSGPDIVGLLTYTKTHRNFNVAWKDSTGEYKSYSVVSTYALTPTEYTETILLIISNDGMDGKGITYTMNGSPQSVPVKMDGGRIEFKMPFDPVSAVFDGDKFIGTNEGVFVDRWEKVDNTGGREVIATANAPAATGPYSQAIRAGNMLYAAGQIGNDPKTGQLVPGGIEAQTHQALKNIQAVLAAAGFSLSEVVQSLVFLADMNDHAAMNAVYSSYFTGNKPARTTVQAARLPKDALVKIMVTAIKID